MWLRTSCALRCNLNSNSKMHLVKEQPDTGCISWTIDVGRHQMGCMCIDMSERMLWHTAWTFSCHSWHPLKIGCWLGPMTISPTPLMACLHSQKEKGWYLSLIRIQHSMQITGAKHNGSMLLKFLNSSGRVKAPQSWSLILLTRFRMAEVQGCVVWPSNYLTTRPANIWYAVPERHEF